MSNTSIPIPPNHRLADTKNNSVTEYSIEGSIDSIVNREEELNKEFPNKDGTTYIQSIDRFNSIGIDSTDSIDRIDSIDDREYSIGDSVNVAATKPSPPQPTAPNNPKSNKWLEVLIGTIGYIVGMSLGAWFLVRLLLYKV